MEVARQRGAGEEKGSAEAGGGGSEVRLVPVTAIREDPELSPRLRLSRGRVRAFAEIMREQGFGPFPPVVLVQRPGAELFDALDGWHRLAAAREARVPEAPAVVVEWTSEREAFAAAVGLSARNGLPLTNREKRRAVLRLLAAFAEMSTRELAERAGVSHNLVAVCRRELRQGERPRPAPRSPSRAQHALRLLRAYDALWATATRPEDAEELVMALARAARQQYASGSAARALVGLTGLLQQAMRVMR
jgi:ParB-like chromosome segregation protein Spo0J